MTACPDCADATPGTTASVVNTVAAATTSGKVCLFMFVSLFSPYSLTRRCTAMASDPSARSMPVRPDALPNGLR